MLPRGLFSRLCAVHAFSINMSGLALSGLVLAGAGAARAQLTPNSSAWNFESSASPLVSTFGPGMLSWRGNTSGITQKGTAAALGLPLLPGGNSGVIVLPTLSAAQGLFVEHRAPANGVFVNDGWVSNYTLVFDLLVPGATFARWRSLYNTNTSNANDGELFIDPAGKLGISGRYHGQIQPDRWHRVAFVVGAADAEGQLQKFIDGAFVGGQGTTGSGAGSRWAIFGPGQPTPGFNLFGDENGETGPIALSGFMFVDRRLDHDQIAALGGPTAGGVSAPGAAPVIPPGTARRVGIVAHRGDSGQSPENSFASIGRALDLGVTAIEVDIRLSSDGIAVLMHDSTVDRTTTAAGNANAFTAAQLTQMDNGSWFDPAFAGERVPTLRQALSLAKSRGGRLYLDVKVSGMGPAIRNAMIQAGVQADEVWIWASSRAQAAEFRTYIPGAPIFIGETPTTQSAINELKALGVTHFDISWGSSGLTPAFINLAHANGMPVCVYTILDQDTMLAAINLGVDMMETDFPRALDQLMLPRCLPDLNLDGEVDFSDIETFIALYNAANPRADFNRDGEIDFSDIESFLALYVSGC